MKKQLKEFFQHSQAQNLTRELVKKQVKGRQFGPEKSDVYSIGSFWALHVFEDGFGGIEIFDAFFLYKFSL